MSVRIGLSLPNIAAQTPDIFWRWVQLCEQGGIDSLWQSDRLVTPDNQPEVMATMAALAGATRRIKFGMNALVVSFRDPLVIAKQCATIDFLSRGRLLPVFVIGSDFIPEWRATGRQTTTRGRHANEFIELVARLWTEDKVTHNGEFYQYKDVSINPKPVQSPLPLWIGGGSEGAIRRTAQLGTGWQGAIASPERTGEIVRLIRDQVRTTQRTIDDDHYGTTVPFRFGTYEDPPVARFIERMAQRKPKYFDQTTCLGVGGAKDIARTFARYVDQGVSKFVAVPLCDSLDDLFQQTERFCQDVVPRVETPRRAA